MSSNNSTLDPASIVIAVDGTSGSGKSSTSRGVADRLGMRYLDTGAMYRAMSWWMLSNGVDVHDTDAVAAAAGKPVITSGTDPLGPTIALDGADVSVEIRSDKVNGAVSPVATVPEVRARLVSLQQEEIARALAAGTGIVVEGRDIGTAVWPQAAVKLYVTADPAARAARRAAEEGGTDADAVRVSLESRDKIDSTKGGAAVPEGATHLDTTPYTLEEVIAQVIEIVQTAAGATPDKAGE
ncbi:cytidylate kinase [Nocardioides albertanoniae]|uniref:Cytidylate kinase n=1 Tax=Nocardioides albertanoniae TaxID=1175486 RepID=A0A543A898_9ACTN|nr:(d)CMP kinase [Nocardioides albertanoniae]TQL68716.1 cytidylate kinase [Nocardioides albertanoniae]